MNVPQFLKEVKSGDFLTTKYGCIICVQRVEITEKRVCVYFFFDYDPKENMFMMNEWLFGYYGPKFDDDKFYRPSTTEEQVLMIDMMAKYGYELIDYYGEMVPHLNHDGFERIRKITEKGEYRMTKDEAIKYLQQLYPNGGHCWLDEQRMEAIDMAVKALKKEPKRIWHDANEKPIKGKIILVVQDNGFPFVCDVRNDIGYVSLSFDHSNKTKIDGKDKWAYIDDLLKL